MHEATISAPNRKWRDYLTLMGKGFVMGSADVVPGVSGGTMAFILGIYTELLDSIRAAANPRVIGLLLRLRTGEGLALLPWQFLGALLVGILAAIFSLAHFIEWALEKHPALVWAFFLGLVLASIVAVQKRVTRWNVATISSAVIGAVSLYVIVGLRPVETPTAPWFIFLSGFIAICAMILPGISGSFILVLLGKYQYILGAVTNRDFFTLLVFTAGTVVGILSFAQVLSRLLHRYPNTTIAFLIGLMVGSLRAIWPWKETLRSPDGLLISETNFLPTVWTIEVTLALLLMVIGFVLVFTIEQWAERQSAQESVPTVA